MNQEQPVRAHEGERTANLDTGPRAALGFLTQWEEMIAMSGRKRDASDNTEGNRFLPIGGFSHLGEPISDGSGWVS